MKAYYLFLAHARARALALALDLALDRALALARDRTRDLALALARDRDRDLGPEPTLDYLLNMALLTAETIEYLYENDRIRGLSGNFSDYFDEVRQKANKILPPLAALKALTVPPKSAPQSAWQNFNIQLRSLLQEHRDLGHEWHLNEKQINALAAYLQANRLLLECLEVAYVADRQGIKNSLLLPLGE